MDQDATYRTHLLFPGRGGDETSPDGRPAGSPSLLQAVFGGSWARRSGKWILIHLNIDSNSSTSLFLGPNGLPLDVRNPTSDPTRYRTTPEMESNYRGGAPGKQVSFVGEEQFSEADPRPERKANSYNCDPLPHTAEKNYAGNFSIGETQRSR
jgi:hypothetical protein